jgi:ubiquinone/menaquinone biosynthesis C-methylase UbiE
MIPSESFQESFRAGEPEALSAAEDLMVWAAPSGMSLLGAVKLLPGMKALDVGCGMGFPLLELASRLGSLGDVTGLDPWTPALERAEAKAKARGLSNVRLVESGAEAMPFGDRSFDLIVSNNGLNNVNDARQALAECARVSRTRAQLVMTANLPETFALFYEMFEMLLEDRGMKAEIGALHEHVRSKRKTAAAWKDLVEEAGFAIRKAREESFTWSFLNGTALFRHWFIRLAFLPSWAALLPPEQAPGFLSFLEGRLDRLALERGGLHLEVPFLCLDALRA